VQAAAGGGVAVQSWLIDHTYPGNLGRIARQPAYLDVQDGRPEGLAGTRPDRNVALSAPSTRTVVAWRYGQWAPGEGPGE